MAVLSEYHSQLAQYYFETLDQLKKPLNWDKPLKLLDEYDPFDAIDDQYYGSLVDVTVSVINIIPQPCYWEKPPHQFVQVLLFEQFFGAFLSQNLMRLSNRLLPNDYVV